MEAFERATGLRPDEYWIEATPGGAPAFGTRTRASDVAHANGARVMGWAAHGERCGGFPDASDERMREMLLRAVERRRVDYPDSEHLTFFGRGRCIELLG